MQVAALDGAEARLTRRVLQGEALGAALQAIDAETNSGTGVDTGLDFLRWLLPQLQRG